MVIFKGWAHIGRVLGSSPCPGITSGPSLTPKLGPFLWPLADPKQATNGNSAPKPNIAWRALRSIRKLQSAGTVTYARVARRFNGRLEASTLAGIILGGPGCYRLTAPSNIVWRNRWRAPRPAVISIPEWHTARIPRAAGTGLVLNVTSWTISGLTVFLAIVAVWLLGI